MLVLLTFHNGEYKSQNNRLIKQSQSLNLFDQYITHTPESLRRDFPDFVRGHSDILSQPRGLGYWLWKPFLIHETVKRLGPSDQVWYQDSGDVIDRPAFREGLLNYFKTHDICLSYSSEFTNKRYTKRDCFYYMGCDEEKYWNAPQAEAGGCGFKRSEISMRFLNQWLDCCYDPRILTDMPNQCSLPNFPEFIDHRHDQSILTNLAIRENITPTDIFRMNGRFNVP